MGRKIFGEMADDKSCTAMICTADFRGEEGLVVLRTSHRIRSSPGN